MGLGGTLIVNAFRATMFPYVYVALRRETAIHGGWEQQIPTHAAVIAFGLPSRSYVPTTHTGVGTTSVFAPKDFFMDIFPPRKDPIGAAISHYPLT